LWAEDGHTNTGSDAPTDDYRSRGKDNNNITNISNQRQLDENNNVCKAVGAATRQQHCYKLLRLRDDQTINQLLVVTATTSP
jgi:hypothetical protein